MLSTRIGATGWLRLFTALVSVVFLTPANCQEPALEDQIRFSAEYQIESGMDSGVILLTVDIADGNYIYALTQKGDVIQPSRINIKMSDSFAVDGFVPDRKPLVTVNDPIFKSDVAKHKGKVVFWAPIKLAEGQSPEDVDIKLSFLGSVCTDKGMCFPIRDKAVQVAFGGYYDRKTPKNR